MHLCPGKIWAQAQQERALTTIKAVLFVFTHWLGHGKVASLSPQGKVHKPRA